MTIPDYRQLLETLDRHKRSGSTIAALNGALNTLPPPLVIGETTRHAQILQEQIEHLSPGSETTAISLGSFLQRKDLAPTPIVFDHHTVYSMISELTIAINSLHSENRRLRDKLAQIRELARLI